MTTQPTIFLDDGGVMNNNSLRGPQWQRLVGEFFVPRLGGTTQEWMEANRIVIERLLEPVAWQVRIAAASNYMSFDRMYQMDWLGGMCELVGLPLLAERECLALAHRAEAFITRRVHATFPGVIDTIRLLYQQGYTLYTASGEPSTSLDGYLHGMGVHDCFGRLYGPDLIDTFKEKGPQYYERIFADVGIAPADALVIDDSPRAIDWAAQVGAQAILVSNTQEKGLCIGSLAELPAIMSRMR